MKHVIYFTSLLLLLSSCDSENTATDSLQNSLLGKWNCIELKGENGYWIKDEILSKNNIHLRFESPDIFISSENNKDHKGTWHSSGDSVYTEVVVNGNRNILQGTYRIEKNILYIDGTRVNDLEPDLQHIQLKFKSGE